MCQKIRGSSWADRGRHTKDSLRGETQIPGGPAKDEDRSAMIAPRSRTRLAGVILLVILGLVALAGLAARAAQAQSITTTNPMTHLFEITSQVDVQATVAARQAATLGTVAVITSTVQTADIGLRLQALRQGGTGGSPSGLSLNFAGPPDLLGSVASSTGSSAPSTSPSVLPSRLGAFANARGSFGNQDMTSREPGFDFHT